MGISRRKIQKWKNWIQDVGSLNRSDEGSDHQLIKNKIKIKAARARNREVNRRKRYNLEDFKFATTKIEIKDTENKPVYNEP